MKIVNNSMSMILNKLSVSPQERLQKKGGRFFGVKAGMLLKTHIEKMSPFCLTIIFMKTLCL
jgi:hypothetical protein